MKTENGKHQESATFSARVVINSWLLWCLHGTMRSAGGSIELSQSGAELRRRAPVLA